MSQSSATLDPGALDEASQASESAEDLLVMLAEAAPSLVRCSDRPGHDAFCGRAKSVDTLGMLEEACQGLPTPCSSRAMSTVSAVPTHSSSSSSRDESPWPCDMNRALADEIRELLTPDSRGTASWLASAAAGQCPWGSSQRSELRGGDSHRALTPEVLGRTNSSGSLVARSTSPVTFAADREGYDATREAEDLTENREDEDKDDVEDLWTDEGRALHEALRQAQAALDAARQFVTSPWDRAVADVPPGPAQTGAQVLIIGSPERCTPPSTDSTAKPSAPLRQEPASRARAPSVDAALTPLASVVPRGLSVQATSGCPPLPNGPDTRAHEAAERELARLRAVARVASVASEQAEISRRKSEQQKASASRRSRDAAHGLEYAKGAARRAHSENAKRVAVAREVVAEAEELQRKRLEDNEDKAHELQRRIRAADFSECQPQTFRKPIVDTKPRASRARLNLLVDPLAEFRRPGAKPARSASPVPLPRIAPRERGSHSSGPKRESGCTRLPQIVQ